METVTLKKWLSMNRKSDDICDLFFNMSLTMKYIHSHGYYVYSFNLNEIVLLDGSVKKIRFNKVVQMSYKEVDEIVRRDIYNMAFMMIGLELNCLDQLRPISLKNNFDEFSKLLNQWNVPYFRGIITRGATVYYSDYVTGMKEKQLKEMGGEALLSQNVSSQDKIVNELNQINRDIYQELDSLGSNAFSRFLILPLLLVFMGTIIVFITIFYQ